MSVNKKTAGRMLAGLFLALCISTRCLAAGTDPGSLLGSVLQGGALQGGSQAGSLLDLLLAAGGEPSSAAGSSSSDTASSLSSLLGSEEGGSPAGTGVNMLLDMLGMSSRQMKDCTVAAIRDQSWTGSAVTPSPVVKYNGTRLKKGTDYTVSYSNNTRAGTAKITLRGKGKYKGTKTVSFRIVRGNASSKKDAESKGSGSSKKTTESKGSGSSGNTSREKAGNAKNKKFTVRLATDTYVYNGKARKPAVKVTARGKTVPKADYTVTYRNNTSVGKASVTVKGKGDYKGYAGEASFKITLKKTALAGASSPGEGIIACRWNADTQADGYQIGYAGNKAFQNARTCKVQGGRKKTAQLEKLTSGKTWYVRIRSYKKVGASNWYSEWSAVRSVKVK